MGKKKIGMFLLSNTWGGAETSMYNIARAIDKNLFDIYFLVNDFLYDRYNQIPNTQTIRLGAFNSTDKIKKVRDLLCIQRVLRNNIHQHSIQLVHARLENALLALYLSVPRLSTPMVYTLSGDETRIYNNPKTVEQRFIRRGIDWLLASTTIQVTSVSRWLVRDFEETKKAKIAITHNGIDCTVFSPNLNIQSYENVILYAGRLVEGKGIQDLVTLAKDMPEYTFWFAGEGPLAEILTLPNTIHLGFKNRDELLDIYAQATICIFPSYAEGMPMIGLETMACGKAIVASQAGFSEYIEDGVDGLKIEPGSLGQIRGAVLTLMQDHKRRSHIEEAARKKALLFDISSTVKNYERVYDQLLTPVVR